MELLIPAKFAATSATAEFTATSLTLIDHMTATNVSAGAVALTVYLVPESGAAASSNAITYQRSIAPGETYTVRGIAGHVLEVGQFISVLCDTANALTIRATGRTVA